MSDEDPTHASGDESHGHAVAEDDSLGSGASEGAEDGHEDGQADESSASDNHSSNDADDDDALLRALAEGKTDDIDSDGEPKKPKAKTPKTEKPAADDALEAEAEVVADKVEEETKPEDAEKAPDGEDEALSPEEQQLLDREKSKSHRKELEKLFKQRAELRKVEKELKPIKEWSDAVRSHASKYGFKSDAQLQAIIDNAGRLEQLPPADAAKQLREWAARIHPESAAPIVVPAEIQDAVTAGYMTQEDAALLAQARANKAAAAKPVEKKPDATASKETPQIDHDSGAPVAEARTGYDAIAQAITPYKARYAASWPKIVAEVQKVMGDRIKDLRPSAWGKEAKRVTDEVIARLTKKTVKPAPKSISSRGAADKGKADVMSEEDELEGLAHGRL